MPINLIQRRRKFHLEKNLFLHRQWKDSAAGGDGLICINNKELKFCPQYYKKVNLPFWKKGRIHFNCASSRSVSRQREVPQI